MVGPLLGSLKLLSSGKNGGSFVWFLLKFTAAALGVQGGSCSVHECITWGVVGCESNQHSGENFVYYG